MGNAGNRKRQDRKNPDLLLQYRKGHTLPLYSFLHHAPVYWSQRRETWLLRKQN